MIAAIQQLLQRLYGVEVPASVEDYLITDRRLADILRGSRGTAPEELLVRETDDAVEMSLFLDPELLERTGRSSPLDRVRGENVAPFCTLLEGVSHFLYLAGRAREDRSVTRLEMELQAEVDKYALLGFLLRAQRLGTLPAWLPRWLFEEVRYRADLSREESDRYVTANAYARRYCLRLQRRFQWAWNGRELLDELRAFYRMGHGGKLRHIRQA